MHYLILILVWIVGLGCVEGRAGITRYQPAESWKAAQMSPDTYSISGVRAERIVSMITSVGGSMERSVTSWTFLVPEPLSNITTLIGAKIMIDTIESSKMYDLQWVLRKAELKAKTQWDEQYKAHGKELLYELNYETVKELREAQKTLARAHAILNNNNKLTYPDYSK